MSKHTPGPWRWDDGDCEDDMPRLMAPSGKVCHFGNAMQYYPTEGKPPSNSDARLIAAAPELLEALKQALEECIWPNERLSDVHDKACAAIAKAEGNA